jgi:DNA-binding CsgD family transcriptional regulator
VQVAARMTAGDQPRQPLKGVSSLPGETPSTPPADRPRRPHPSSRTPSGLLQLSHRFTPRDLHLARLLAEHRTLTTSQITDLLFTHPGTARNRLRQLREIGFLDRFTHRTPDGTRLTCWVPGLLSARYTALADDQPPPTPRAVRTAQDRILANPQLDHLLGVNQFFTDLAHHTRTHPRERLIRWWSAERTANAYAGRIHPDGHGLWQAPQPQDDGTAAASVDTGTEEPATVGFWLEHDTGSMPLTRLIAKLEAYRRLQDAGGPPYPVLMWLPSHQREQHLHDALSATSLYQEVTVATAVHTSGRGGPASSVWALAPWTVPPGAATSPTRMRLEALSQWPNSTASHANSGESAW